MPPPPFGSYPKVHPFFLDKLSCLLFNCHFMKEKMNNANYINTKYFKKIIFVTFLGAYWVGGGIAVNTLELFSLDGSNMTQNDLGWLAIAQDGIPVTTWKLDNGSRLTPNNGERCVGHFYAPSRCYSRSRLVQKWVFLGFETAKMTGCHIEQKKSTPKIPIFGPTWTWNSTWMGHKSAQHIFPHCLGCVLTYFPVSRLICLLNMASCHFGCF